MTQPDVMTRQLSAELELELLRLASDTIDNLPTNELESLLLRLNPRSAIYTRLCSLPSDKFEIELGNLKITELPYPNKTDYAKLVRCRDEVQRNLVK